MKRIGIFCGISYGLTYLIAFYLMFNGGAQNPLYSVGLMACMLTPALAHVLTRLLTKEGFKDCYLRPNLKKKNVKYYLLAWLGTEALILGGALIYYLIYFKAFDPSLGTLQSLLTSQAQFTGTTLPTLTTPMLWGILAGQLISAMTFAVILNAPFMFGEEFGWRAYLLPKLIQEKGMGKALLYSGVIWGLWHAPIIAMGHNYGLNYPLFPIPGIVMMVGFCIVVGILMAFITVRTHSVWPAVICHAIINGTASISVFMHTPDSIPNPFIGPTITGIVGGLGFILCAIYLFRKLIKS